MVTSDHLGTAGRVANASGRHSTDAVIAPADKPVLLFFYSPTSGESRRVEGFLAQVLQRRRNHDTFALRRVDYASRPDLAARFGIQRPPALVVVERKRVRAKSEQPSGCVEIRTLLAAWLK